MKVAKLNRRENFPDWVFLYTELGPSVKIIYVGEAQIVCSKTHFWLNLQLSEMQLFDIISCGFGEVLCKRFWSAPLCRATGHLVMPPRALLAAMQDASDDIKVAHSSLAKANRAGGSAEAVRNRAAGLGVAEKLGLQHSNVIAVVNHLRWAGPPPKSNESIRERFKYNTAAHIWFQATMQVLGARAEREFVCGPLPKDLNRRRIRKRSRRPAVRVEVAQPTDDAPPGGRLPSDSAILLEEIFPPVSDSQLPARGDLRRPAC